MNFVQRRPQWLLGAFAVCLCLWAAWLARHLLLSTALAAFLVVLFSPLQRRLQPKLHRMPTAMILTTVALLAVVLPVGFIFYLIVQQLGQFVAALKGALGHDGIENLFNGSLPPAAAGLLHKVQSVVPIPDSSVQDSVGSLAQQLPKSLGGALGLSFRSIVHLVFLSFGIFYFFLDGDRFVTFLRDVSPFEQHHTRIFIKEFENVAWAMIFGSGLSAAIGAVGCVLGFWALKVPNPLFWGVLTGVFSLAPSVGSALIFLPMSAVFAFLGHPWQALGVSAFCFVFLVMVNDNVLRPLLVGQRLHLHPFAILLAIFGGVEAYGVSGLFVGPLVAALAVTALRIYRREHGAHVGTPHGTSTAWVGTRPRAIPLS